jgi:hypothetical protein
MEVKVLIPVPQQAKYEWQAVKPWKKNSSGVIEPYSYVNSDEAWRMLNSCYPDVPTEYLRVRLLSVSEIEAINQAISRP